MASTRKLQGEIDRTLKKVQEGVDLFDEIWNKVYNATNANQKEKYEADLKKEIKKLQRYRDQIKTWMTNGDIKDKRPLADARKNIETEMERFKVCEKEFKTKAYSKEGLGQQAKQDPKDIEKNKIRSWITSSLEALSEQVDGFEAELEGLNASKKKKKDSRADELQQFIEQHHFHESKLEQVLRLIENESLTPEDVENALKESVEYYISDNQEPDFMDDDSIYDELGLDDEPQPALGSGKGSKSAQNEDDEAAVVEPPPDVKPEEEKKGAPPPDPMKAPLSVTANASLPKKVEPKAMVLPKGGGLPPPAAKPGLPTGLPPGKQGGLPAPAGLPPPLPQATRGKATAAAAVVAGQQPFMHMPPSAAAVAGGAMAPGGQQPPRVMARGAVPPPGRPSKEEGSEEGFEYTDKLPAAKLPAAPMAVRGAMDFSPLAQSHRSGPPSANAPLLPTPSSAISQPSIGLPAAGSKGKAEDVKVVGKMDDVLDRKSAVQTPSGFPTADVKSSTGFSTSLDPKVPAGGFPSSDAKPPTSMPFGGGMLDGKTTGSGAFGVSAESKAPVSSGFDSKLPPGAIDSKAPAGGFGGDDGKRLFMQPVTSMGGGGGKDELEEARDLRLLGEEDRSALQDFEASLVGAGDLAGVQDGAGGAQAAQDDHLQMLHCSLRNIPEATDSERPKQYLPRNPYPTPSSFPQTPAPIFDNPAIFEKFDTDTLFFIFYYQQGTYQQYLAARELKKQAWRYHKKYLTWFQRHEEPKVTTDEYEQGTYVYFDYETGWCQRIKTEFTFEYTYLEDELVV